MGKVPTQTLQLECSLVTKYFSEMHLEPCQVSVKLLFAKTVTLECPLIEGGGEEVVVVLVEGLGGGGAGGLENTSKLCLINTVRTLLNTKTESSRSVLVAVTFKKQHIFESNIFF